MSHLSLINHSVPIILSHDYVSLYDFVLYAMTFTKFVSHDFVLYD